MASIYKRAGQKTYSIRYKADGIWKGKTTCWQTDSQLHRAKALAEAAELSVHEQEKLYEHHGWVRYHIENWPASHLTISHYLNSWNWLELFLSEHGLQLSQFGPAAAEAYITWRCGDRRPADAHRHRSGHQVHRNQACRDVKMMKWIQRQGRLLGRLQTHALDDYRIKYSPKIRSFPPFTPEQITLVRAALSSPVLPRWMGISFEIGLATGCRLRETAIPLDGVDLVAKTMTFPCPKGGTDMSFTIPIPAALVGLLAKLKADGETMTCTLPPKASYFWRQLFNRLGLRVHCFHSLRVTRVTELRKAGVPQSVSMRLVNHSSHLVHQLYQRHEVEDLRQFVDRGAVATILQRPVEKPAHRSRGTQPHSTLGGRRSMGCRTPNKIHQC
jgi:hypothetical protein